jgi:protein involved in polysaccharide export with SLBB domain
MGKAQRKQEKGKGGSGGKPRRPFRLVPFAFCLVLQAGCALTRPYLDEALLAQPEDPARNRDAAARYLIACPDVLDVAIAGRPDCGGRHAVTTDGRIDLGAAGRLRVEGLPLAGVVRRIAEDASVPPESVRVDVVEHNSQQVYLVGDVAGSQRAVPYEGPETVLDLLRRTGGIRPGAAPGEVHVIRPGVAEGRPPEDFHIDLEAIVRDGDERTNLRLQPFDQVYVGESRRSSFARCVPPCLRGLYGALCGLYRGHS